MYVRWKKRPRLWTAQLVESTRHYAPSASTPRQVILATLAAIDTTDPSVVPREWFWRQFELRLGPFKLSTLELTTLRASVALVVPRPTRAELANVDPADLHWVDDWLVPGGLTPAGSLRAAQPRAR